MCEGGSGAWEPRPRGEERGEAHHGGRQLLGVELIDGVVDVLKHIGDLLIVLMVCGQVLQAGSLLMAISFTQCCLITFKMHHSISIGTVLDKNTVIRKNLYRVSGIMCWDNLITHIKHLILKRVNDQRALKLQRLYCAKLEL